MELSNFYKESLIEQYGVEKANKIEEGLKENLPLTLRVNTIKSNIEEIKTFLNEANILFEEVGWYKDALIIKNITENEIQKFSIYSEGKIYLQSLSSMIPAIILNPKENENILDMCSAPGGKTTQLASISNNKAFITAVEQNKIRSEKLKYNLQKQGAKSVNVLIEDARNLSDYLKFDKILLDAPCSGSGTENVFKNNFTKELIEKSSKRQETLLKKALKILKLNGEIIYSTCSILKQENEDILDKVLKNNKNYIIENIEMPNEIPLIQSKIEGVSIIQPNELFEGFFVAKIKRIK